MGGCPPPSHRSGGSGGEALGAAAWAPGQKERGASPLRDAWKRFGAGGAAWADPCQAVPPARAPLQPVTRCPESLAWGISRAEMPAPPSLPPSKRPVAALRAGARPSAGATRQRGVRSRCPGCERGHSTRVGCGCASRACAAGDAQHRDAPTPGPSSHRCRIPPCPAGTGAWFPQGAAPTMPALGGEGGSGRGAASAPDTKLSPQPFFFPDRGGNAQTPPKTRSFQSAFC